MMNCIACRFISRESIFIFALFILVHFQVYGQPYERQITSLSLSYCGNNVWNPGLSAGLEIPVFDNTVTSRKGKDLNRMRILIINAGTYIDPGSHMALFATGGIENRKVRNSGFYTSSGFYPLGLYRSFLPTTFEVTGEGNVRQVNAPGRFYYSPELSLGIGRLYEMNPGTGWFARLDMILLIPYNTYAMPLFITEAGYRLNIHKIK